MKRYIPQDIEPKWQKVWEQTKLYAARDNDPREKYYYLVEFPYPSGEGLHVGHVLSFTALDIMARHKRMLGFNVLYPMGFDEFGLPTENFAIKHKIAPQVATEKNVNNFRRQMQNLGLSFDWDREVNTSDPNYYKWTQWIFLQMYKAGLAYQDEIAINWCPFEKTGLANEEVVNGKHERCGTTVEKKLLKQWILRITAYADRLIDDLKTVDYLDRISSQQINWIGRSEGAEISFAVKGLLNESGEILNQVQDDNTSAGAELTVYTTRPDTLFGATFLVASPEVVKTWLDAGWQASAEVEKYVAKALNTSDLERQEEKSKTGVDTGLKAINPLSGAEIPVWVADYVLGSYGTGAIMAVPAHDERDNEFARKFGLPITEVIVPNFGEILPDAVNVSGPVVIGYDPSTKQLMSLINNNNNMRWLVSGGIEDGESFESAALRELKEEAGFDKVKQLIGLGSPTFSYYYNPNKKSNRRSFSYMYLAIIDSADQGNQLQESHENFKVVWSDAEAILSDFAKEPDGRGHWIDGMSRAVQAAKAYDAGQEYVGPTYVGRGTLINSGEFDGLDSDEAKSKIIEALVAKGAGKGAKKYKLRDWVFSRQHYWGEPIPVVHCVGCAVGIYEPKLSLSFYDQTTWDAMIAGVKTVESRALNPDEKDRYFGDVQTGDVVELVNKKTGVKAVASIQDVRRYDSVKALHSDTEWATACSSSGKLDDLEAWEKVYSGYTPDYTARIAKHGIVAWKIKVLDEVVPVPEDQLPVTLPVVESYEPTDTGESPLAAITDWVNVACPKCGGPAKRETDTMPNWAGSSWYYLRYADPHNDQAFADPDKLKYWTPVDLYNGGMEHTTLHLLYSRFWHKFLFDQGLVPTAEPYARRRSHGMILGPDGVKMSKSRGNVINPDGVVDKYGADSIRLYEMFMGPYDEYKIWSDDHLNGVNRFLYRVWTLAHVLMGEEGESKREPVASIQPEILATEVDRLTHKTIKKVHEDIEIMHFNTAVSALMEYINFLNEPRRLGNLLLPENRDLAQRTVRALTLILAPFTPHIAEEIWQDLGETTSVHAEAWPKYDPDLIKEDLVTIVVQVNGKVRASLVVPIESTQDELVDLARADEKVAKYLAEGEIVKTIVVPRKLVSFVVK